MIIERLSLQKLASGYNARKRVIKSSGKGCVVLILTENKIPGISVNNECGTSIIEKLILNIREEQTYFSAAFFRRFGSCALILIITEEEPQSLYTAQIRRIAERALGTC